MAAVKKVLILVVPVIVLAVLFGAGCQKKEDADKAQKESVTPTGLSAEESASLEKRGMPPNMGKQFPKEMMEALEKSRQETVDSGPVEKADMSVTVPPDVQGKWKAVIIEVANKQMNEQKDYLVDINQDFIIPNTKIKIHVVTFLPDFSMSPKGITSLSNEPRNPAAKVVVYEDGKEIFGGWLFEKMPTVHPFEHDVYAIKLKDQKPA